MLDLKFSRRFCLNHAETHNLSPAPSGFLLDVFFDCEDGGDVLPKRPSLFELLDVRGQIIVSFETYSVNLFITRLRCLCNE
jgi:hypothetical protein